MAILKDEAGRLERRYDSELLVIEAWGENSLRIRATRRQALTGNDWALMPRPRSAAAVKIGEDGSGSIRNGKLEARINKEGWLSLNNTKGELLLEEYWRNRADLSRYTSTLNLAGRELKPIPGGDWGITLRIEAQEGEKIFGLGQYAEPFLDKKGSVLELAHRNMQSSVPFALSSRGYGFLWNNPAVGRVSFARNITEWTVQDSLELDYWVTAGDSPADIEEQYAAVTGTVPMMPDYGLGFTQCKLRYRNQAELLEAAREYKRRGLPIDMIVADFFHWTVQGEWTFDPIDWPDVEGMVAELKGMGIELMVSIWPTVDTRSRYYQEMLEKGYLIQVDRGMRINMNWMGETLFFDPTDQGAREFVWSKAKEHYYDKGVRVFWLDEAEPEFGIYDFDIYRYRMGPALQVTNIYPMMYAKAFYDGLKSVGQTEILNLVRTAWAGSQRYGALTWSGDINSSFRSLREQLAAGLSMAIAGIPWWTTDIGGFIGGKPEDPSFRELMVRWFQWGAFCPVFRLHGERLSPKPPLTPYHGEIKQFGSGADNEVWCYGDDAYGILAKYMHMRERLKPYVKEQMRAAHEKGTPVMRPLFYDFPKDQAAWDVEDEYMFGPDLLVAPVTTEGARERDLYLPAGSRWTNAFTGECFEGGRRIAVAAPLEEIPLFLRDGAQLPIRG
jgi:Alpha-glucosidases, family 31 of glycosyl hydrolases